MKINEVERLVGVTKRNIRFYEKEGLLAPDRNAENGYRDYGEADVETLKKIKLLRKLDLPLEEIRRMQRGTLTLSDGMRRHVIQLEREQENLETMKLLCGRLRDAEVTLAALEAEHYLEEMEQLEREGTNFVNIKKNDTRKRYVGPILAAAVFTGLMGAVIALMVWAFAVDPEGAPPLPVLIFLLALPVVPVVGVFLALIQRFKQIKGGEEDVASKY
ncbi:MerR family transcriptional regulator [Lawsonibacter celer]|uniref:MerR family transcriptional regulator n=1 Tax=Lawsonibacter celer TaxID=2986526 RepID=UPI001647FF89|nr:MerR family transcriptional regulator [Lawsonibacter celer]